MIVLAVLVALSSVQYRSVDPGTVAPWLLHLDRAAGVLALVALLWRRRFPVALAAGAIVLATFAETVGGVVLVALFTVAVHRPPRTTAVLLGAALAAFACYHALRPEPDMGLEVLAPLVLATYGAAVGWGLHVRNRRQLVASLRARAAAAEVEAGLRTEHARHEARESLAREMHDVLGHRLSLLSVHAGALVYNREATQDDVALAAEVIRENAHRALRDLREVIDVLRAPVDELPPPGVTDIARLVEETRQAGTPVALHDAAGVTTTDLPATLTRSLYRFVQEGLTNVRRHAPGAATDVRIDGGPGAGLTAAVVNGPPPGPPLRPVSGPVSGPVSDGSGEGLRGLAERAALVGGRVEHGPTGTGGWRVGLWLPWPG